MEVINDHRSEFPIAMIIYHFHIHPQFIYELFHIHYIRIQMDSKKGPMHSRTGKENENFAISSQIDCTANRVANVAFSLSEKAVKL